MQELGKMTVTPKISINDGDLVVHGKTILTGVPDNIVLTPGSGVGLVAGTFIGATTSDSKSIHVFPMGTLESVLLSLIKLPSFGRKASIFYLFCGIKICRDSRFMCLFRFKLWWMTQRMGTCGKEIPLETQFMLIESKQGADQVDVDVDIDDAGQEEGGRTIYTAILPLLEGQFRAVLQGNEKNEVEICLESGE